MKKLDKLILSSFIGPFILTFLVVVFILLTQHMLKYFDDIIGKGLGIDVIGQLLFYFAIFMTPIAMPLAVLLSSLIAYGNLGEHFELTAVKSAGISLVRTLLPIFYFVVILTAIAFYVNNNLVPKAALEAYSLLYDIKQKKPALDLREGSFYDGIPDMSIKINKKFPDGVTIKDVIIYDHRKHDGNKDVTLADSGKMYTILNESYLKLELFNGSNYTEGAGNNQDMAGKVKSKENETLSRTNFSKTQVVFDLSSFNMERTDPKWFQGNRIMRNLSELDSDMDSIDNEILNARLELHTGAKSFFNYRLLQDSLKLPEDLYRFKVWQDSMETIKLHYNPEVKNKGEAQARKAELKKDSVQKATGSDTLKKQAARSYLVREGMEKKKDRKKFGQPEAGQLPSPSTKAAGTVPTDTTKRMISASHDKATFESAAEKARSVKNQIAASIESIKDYNADRRVFQIQWYKILASSFACVAMFLIGAPLGAIIKKGGLGVPFLVSILFFIIYYLLTMTGEKWAKQGIISVPIGVWAGDVILFIVGLLFLRQARLDARLFEADFYLVLWDKAKKSSFVKRFLPTQA